MKKTLLLLFVSFVLSFSACQKRKLVASFSVDEPPVKKASIYPDDWWFEFDEQTADPPIKSWEILPHTVEAKPGEERTHVILSKRTNLGIFSNFGKAYFKLDGVEYASIEGLWQSMKYPESSDDERFDASVSWDYTREEVRMMTGFEAKDAGKHAGKNMKTLGIQWVSYQGEKFEYKGDGQDRHYEIIYAATEAKIMQNEALKRLLLRTGDLILLPDHDQGPNPLASYQYYTILMDIRDRLKAE